MNECEKGVVSGTDKKMERCVQTLFLRGFAHFFIYFLFFIFFLKTKTNSFLTPALQRTVW